MATLEEDFCFVLIVFWVNYVGADYVLLRAEVSLSMPLRIHDDSHFSARTRVLICTVSAAPSLAHLAVIYMLPRIYVVYARLAVIYNKHIILIIIIVVVVAVTDTGFDMYLCRLVGLLVGRREPC